MELAIKNKVENKMLGRQTLTCEIGFEKAVPSRKEIREAICTASGVDPNLLVIVSVNSQFGTKRATATAHAYANKEAMAVEGKHLLIRDGMAEKKKKVAKAKAPPKK